MKDKYKKNNQTTMSLGIEPTSYHFSDHRRSKLVPEGEEVLVNNRPYVNWGKKNDYPLFLNGLYEDSPSQTGIINGKTYYMTAGGYTITTTIVDQQLSQLVALFEKNEATDYNLQDLLNSVTLDFELYNGFAIRGKWNMDGTRPAFIEHIGFDDIRTNKHHDRFFYSDDWTDSNQSFEKTGFREIPSVDFNNKKGEFIIYYVGASKKVRKGGKRTYPSIPYAGCIKSLLSQIGMQAYHYYEIQNGFKSGTIINLPSSKPKTQNDQALIADRIKSGAVNEEEAGGVVVLFSEGATEPPTILSLSGNDLDKRYLQTEVSVANTILMCHSITTPSLFGMVVAGQLGNSTELENGFNIFKNTYVKSRQKAINDVIDYIMNNLYQIKGEFKLNLPPDLFASVEVEDTNNAVSIAINSMSPLVANKLLDNLTVNEIRALGKLPKIEGGDELPTSAPMPSVAPVETMASQDPILKALLKCGRKREGFIFKSSSSVPHEVDNDWFDSSEKELLEAVHNEKHFFATILTEFQKNVLALVNDGQDVKSVATALDKSVGEVMDAYNELSQKGLIKKNGELTAIGRKYLDSVEVDANKFEIRYSYELRTNAPKLSKNGIGESRPFCKALMDAERMYTRDEIDQISIAVDRNVWAYRGGWYHNPNTKQNTPYCRHQWVQSVVIKK